jgi:hypothetical protein
LGLISEATSNYKFVTSATVYQAEEQPNMGVNGEPITYTNYHLGLKTRRGEEIVLETRDRYLNDDWDNRLNGFLKSQQLSFKLVRDTRFDLNLEVNQKALTIFLVFLGSFGLLGIGAFLAAFYSWDITLRKSQNMILHRQTLL